MRKGLKKYWLYILSTSFSIMIFYIFLAIKYDDTALLVASGVEEYKIMFSVVSVVIAVFSAVFIWYSNGFFMRERKKEVALFMLVGVSKGRIGRMLFLENIIVGCISLIIGVGSGILLSKLFVMILLKMMMQTVPIHFTVSFKAMGQTVIVFAILLIIASMHAYGIVFRVKLIELFTASKRREYEPKARPIKAILAIIMISYGYYLSQTMVSRKIYLSTPLKILFFVICGTFFLFSATFVSIVKFFKKRKSISYKGSNLITFSNLQYRIRQHSNTLALIAVMTASTISALGAVYGMYVVSLNELENDLPYSYVFNDEKPEVTNKIYEIIGEYKKHEILFDLKREFVSVTGTLTNEFQGEIQTSTRSFYLMKYSEFIKVLKEREMDSDVMLNDDQVFYVNSYYAEQFDHVKNMVVEYAGEKFNVVNGYRLVVMSMYHDGLIIVVSDNKYESIKQALPSENIVQVVAIKVDNQLLSKELSDKLTEEIVNKEGISIADYYKEFVNMSQLRAIILFTGAFMGLVFLTATGSIIYFKMITEAQSDANKYSILMKIGISQKTIMNSVAKQIGIIFLLPLLVGIIHATFALWAFGDMLVGDEGPASIVAIISYIAIYGIYYFLTLLSYKRKMLDRTIF